MAPSKAYTCRLPDHESRLIERLTAENPMNRAEILRRAFRFYTSENPDDLFGLPIRSVDKSNSSIQKMTADQTYKTQESVNSTNHNGSSAIQTKPEEVDVNRSSPNLPTQTSRIYDPTTEFSASH